MIIHIDNKPLTLIDKVDRDGMLYYVFYLKPPVWGASKELIVGDIVRPSNPTGYYYQVTSSGITGANEPVWTTTKNSITTDNTVKYKALDNNSYLSSNATLDTNLSSFSVSDNVPIVDSYFTLDGEAGVQVGPVPSTLSSFKITLEMKVDTGHPLPESDERSIIVKVTDL